MHESLETLTPEHRLAQQQGKEALELAIDGWQELSDFAVLHNRDPAGVYVELHDVAGVVIPLAAPLATGWEVTSSLGYVVEGSGHSLAEMIAYQYEHPSEETEPYLRQLLNSNSLLKYVADLKLNSRSVLGRGRLRTGGKGDMAIEIDATKSYREYTQRGKGREAAIVSNLKSLYDTSLLVKTSDTVVKPTIEPSAVTLTQIEIDYERIYMQDPERRYGEVLSVLTGIEQHKTFVPLGGEPHSHTEADVVEFSWVAAQTQMHNYLFQEIGIESSVAYPLTINGQEFSVAARTQPDYNTGNEEIFWLISGNNKPTSSLVELLKTASHKVHTNNTPLNVQILYSQDPARGAYTYLSIE